MGGRAATVQESPNRTEIIIVARTQLEAAAGLATRTNLARGQRNLHGRFT